LVEAIAAFIEAHHAWAMPLMFLIAFGESLAFVGLFVPATMILAAIGVLLASGTLDFVEVLVATAIGATVGDAVSYWIGRALGPACRERWPFNQRPQLFDWAIAYFQRWGVISIFLGRYLGPLRSTVPLVAGIVAMPQLKFQLANLVSAWVWSITVLAPGMLLGFAFEAFGLSSGEALLAAVGVAVVIALVILLVRRLRPRAASHVDLSKGQKHSAEPVV